MKSTYRVWSGCLAGRRISFGALAMASVLASPAVAGAWSGSAAMGAAGVAPPTHLAQFVCDTSGCGTGSGRAGPLGGYMGRPYYGKNAEERRALEERDRLRRERAERNGGSQNSRGR